MSKETRKVRDRWRAKAWYEIISPSYFGGKEIGRTLSGDPKSLVGRVLETSLYEFTGDPADQRTKLFFQVTSVEDAKASTVFKGHEYGRDYLRSLVRRGSTRIDGVFDLTTKDGYRMRVSIVAFSLVRVKASQENAVREIMRKIVGEKAKTLNFDQFAHELVMEMITRDIYNEAKKIFPIRQVGARKSKLTALPSMEKAVEEVAVA